MAIDCEDPDATDTCVVQIEASLKPSYGEPDNFITSYKGNILSGSDEVSLIGKVTASIIRLDDALNNGLQAYEVLDSVDDSIAKFSSLISIKDGMFKRSIEDVAGSSIGTFLALGFLEIAPKYRGKSLGIQTINLLCDHLGRGCLFAAFMAYPTQWSADYKSDRPRGRSLNSDRASLMNYYRKARFCPAIGNGMMIRSLGE